MDSHSVADSDPGFGAYLTPGCAIRYGKKFYMGAGFAGAVVGAGDEI
jgi:hypothetical protein